MIFIVRIDVKNFKGKGVTPYNVSIYDPIPQKTHVCCTSTLNSYLEPSEWASSYIKDKLNIKVVNNSLREWLFPENSFDVITLVDVIEHLYNPRRDLESAYKILKPGGVLYIVTPDISSFSSTVLGEAIGGV